jgi:NAD(P)-dependent dehydrogenase (short-subunit alcohol dehydrogenase family)
MIDINLTGQWNTCRASIPIIQAAGRGGSVVIVSSVAGLRGYPYVGHYVAAKHGLVGIMRTLANELGAEGIRVNTVHPTNVDTPMIMHEGIYKMFRPDLESPTVEDFAEAAKSMQIMDIPWVDPEDITSAALFLASDESRYITGIALPIDGGASIKV